nr:MAG TPA: hypothetical protein [Crassvirales sp.]
MSLLLTEIASGFFMKRVMVEHLYLHHSKERVLCTLFLFL